MSLLAMLLLFVMVLVRSLILVLLMLGVVLLLVLMLAFVCVVLVCMCGVVCCGGDVDVGGAGFGGRVIGLVGVFVRGGDVGGVGCTVFGGVV